MMKYHLWLCACLCAGVATARADRPNLLWITSEDNGRFLGCYGDPVADTPNLDALAARGIRFTRCYANAPVCAPVRNSWILGMPAVTAGTHHMRSRYRVPEALVPYPVLLRRAGYYATNNAKTDYNTSSFEKEIWDACGTDAHYRDRPAGTPFFAVFNVGASHEGQIFDEHYPGRYPATPATPAEAVTLPPYQVRTPETVSDWRRAYDRIADMDRAVGRLLDELEASGEAARTIVVYCSDHAGITLRSKRYLYDSGTRVPLLVYVPEAWRDLAPGPAGSVSDRLVQFIDLPRTFLALAGAEVPDRMTGRVFMGAAPEPAPETVLLFSGRFDEAPEMRRGLADGRWKYIRNYEPDRPRFQLLDYPLNQAGQVSQWRAFRAGRTDALQAAHYRPQDPEELYDTAADPHEVRNLAADPAQAGRLDRMRRALDAQLLAARDTGFLPEPMMAAIDADPATTLHAVGQSAEAYALERILPAANRAARRDPAALPDLEAGLRDPNPVIRYWSALGLRVLGPAAAPARGALEAALGDDEASVRIPAAVALGTLGDRERALALLVAEARAARTDAHALWALDGIKYLDAPEAVAGLDEEDVARGRYSSRAYQHLAAGGSLHRLPGDE